MTALAGVWNISGKPDARASCQRMLAAQRVYGPDGDAVSDMAQIAIGRCLFEILPEDRYDRGPVTSSDGRYVLVGDVRLDDREELARACAIQDDAAQRLSDSAFLLRAWERWQEGCFEHLYGNYAFALWDCELGRLILARDHIGTRPLHYHRSAGLVAFASMPKGLHALPEVPYAPNEAKLAEMLALLPEVGTSSFFTGIERVEGGHYVTITREGVTSHRHWAPTPQSIGTWSGDDPAQALRAHLDRAVATCLRGAEDKVGAHLSAGFDSAAVASTAARLMASSGGRVTAFTAVPRAGYDRPAPRRRIGDEGPLAAATAAMYPNIDHVLVRGTADAVNQNWDQSFYLLERPLLNPCNDRWWTAINAEANRRGINVMLTGEMGNMTLSFAGLELLPELVRKGAWGELWRQARALVRKRRMRWPGVAAAAFGPWIPARLWAALLPNRVGARGIRNHTGLSARQAREMNLERLAKARGLDPSYRPRKDAFESRLWVLHRIDKGNFQKAALGGHGIDQRDPTADRRLIEFCLSLPTALFLADGEIRALGMRALADRLPAEVLGERRKGYQAVDWHEGLAAAAVELEADLARLENLPAAALLDLPRIRRLAADLPADGWERSEVIQDYRLALLRGSAAGHFLRRATKTNH